jgi:hypothetical protein
MPEELTPLPCPFCGGHEVQLAEGSTFRWRELSCNACGATCGETRVQTMGTGTPDEWGKQVAQDAIRDWNRRAQPEPAAPADDPNLIGLLCLVHRDGGHYIQEHGLAKAVADAHEALYLWREAFDAAPSVAPEPVAHCWSVSVDGRFLFHSADLHDARLRLDGDFEWDDDRLAFAKEVIAKLNATHPPRAPLTDAEIGEACFALYTGPNREDIAESNAGHDISIARLIEAAHGISTKGAAK